MPPVSEIAAEVINLREWMMGCAPQGLATKDENFSRIMKTSRISGHPNSIQCGDPQE